MRDFLAVFVYWGSFCGCNVRALVFGVYIRAPDFWTLPAFVARANGLGCSLWPRTVNANIFLLVGA